MIGAWDDLPLHQTPAPLAEPATTDPAAYERYYFGFFDTSGSAAVGLVLNVHPNKGLIDAAFSVSADGRHESLFAKDSLGPDRQDLRCGPVRLTLTQPMTSLRIRVAGHGFDADLVFHASSPAIEEARVVRRRDDRVVQDRSRYVQLGRLTGRVTAPQGELVLDAENWFGGRDHSWGIWDAPRGHAADLTSDATADVSPSFFWLIGSFDDWAIQAVTHADAGGRTYGEYAAVCPTLKAGADIAGPGTRQQARPVIAFTTAHAPGTWHISTASVAVGGAEPGAIDTIDLESLHAVLPRSVGYGHRDWIFGDVPDTLPEVVVESLVLREQDLTERANHRALQLVRMTRADGAVGYGVVDQCVTAAAGRPTAAPAPSIHHRLT